MPGPQDHRFQPGALPALLSAQWQVTTAYDRMGMRLDGPPLALAGATPGKRALGLQVVMDSGLPVTPAASRTALV